MKKGDDQVSVSKTLRNRAFSGFRGKKTHTKGGRIFVGENTENKEVKEKLWVNFNKPLVDEEE